MRAKFWNFSKRENSLKQPPATAPWSPEVNLKSQCSLLSPSFLLGSSSSAADITQYNYCQIESGQYYYIDEWISVRNDLWMARCSMDLLATYREEILQTIAFVEYDESPNTWVVDHRLSLVQNGTRAANSAEMSLTRLVTGAFILCCTGQNGSVTYFRLPPTFINRLLDNVRDWSDIQVAPNETDLQDIFAAFCTWATKSLSTGSAPSNIRGCIWVPWEVDDISPQRIYLGTYNTGISGGRINTPVQHGGLILAIPWQASDWRQCSMCHTFELYLPYCGTVGIDAGLLAGESEIIVDWSVDFRTGDIVYIVNAGDVNGMALGSYSGNAGVSIPIGIASYNPVGTAGSIFSAVSAIAGGNIAGAAGSLAQTAQNILVPNVTAVGTQTSGASAALPQNDRVTITSLFHNTNVAPSSVTSVMGTPAMASKQLSALSGFVKCRGASVSATAGKSQLAQINAYLNGGFFIE